jgi:hypothetical protein
MTIRAWIGITLIGSLVSACGGIETSSEHDPRYAFGEATTWDWMPEPEEDALPGNPPIVYTRVRRAIESTMDAKGLRHDSTDPDLRVAYHLALENDVDQTTISTYYDDWGLGFYSGRVGQSGGGAATVNRTYTAGSLIIDIFDVDTRQLVWRGSGEDTVTRAEDPHERQAYIDDAVSSIMRDFPPGG